MRVCHCLSRRAQETKILIVRSQRVKGFADARSANEVCAGNARKHYVILQMGTPVCVASIIISIAKFISRIRQYGPLEDHRWYG